MSAPILFRAERDEMNRHRLSHSEISGSMPVCGCPELIAAYHVLHRLLVPRHPLHALCILHCVDPSPVDPAKAGPEIDNTWVLLSFVMKPVGLKNCSIEFVSTLYAVVKELGSEFRSVCRVTDGGQDWTRTSDPRLIKAVL